jgi:hypothetical protein
MIITRDIITYYGGVNDGRGRRVRSARGIHKEIQLQIPHGKISRETRCRR